MLINGQPATTVDANDRGLLYGDGVFETLAVRHGRPQCWTAHWQRLRAGCEALAIAAPDEELLYQEAVSLCNSSEQSVLKILVTRGAGGRGYRPSQPPATPTRIVSRHDWPDFPSRARTEGVKVRLCELRLARQPRLAGIKHLNRLEQVLARLEWDDPEIAEGLLRDDQDRLIEGTMSNLFLVRGGDLITPDLRQCGVAGVVRQLIMEDLCGHGYPVHIQPVDEDQLLQADEVFLCNSLFGIWPVRQYEQQPFKVGEVSRAVASSLDRYLTSSE